MNTVVVPLYRRPEFFEIWGELVQKAKGARDCLFIFCLDFGYDPLHDKLIDQFPYAFGKVRTPRTPYRLAKQSYNVLNGLMLGARHSDGLVYYVEEDVFIGRDFFQWHAEVHRQQPGIFCSIATRNNNTHYRVNGRLEQYYLSDRPDYQALGTCFKKEVLESLVGPHFSERYFRDPVGYCKYRFPGSAIGPFYVEQDGLLRRIVEENRLPIAFPHVPRAFHGGIYGYNRPSPGVQRWSYEQRLARIREVAFDRDQLKAFVTRPEYFADSEPCDLETSFDYLEQRQPIDFV